MSLRDEIIDLITKKCENELNYYDVVNESAEMVDFRLITEFISGVIFDVWKDEKNAD